jgi:hypothetical protein
MKPNHTSGFPLMRRWREPRLLILMAGVTLMVVVTALALVPTPTVAAPPPPLRLPFRLIKLPDDIATAAATTNLAWTPFYTQTFDSSFYADPYWTITSTPGLNTTTWGRVLDAAAYPSLNLTSTLWAAGYPGPGLPVTYTVYAGATYAKNMDAWAVLRLPGYQNYAQALAEFDYYLNAGPGATFGWAVSSDGQTFCYHTETSGDIQKWQHFRADLPQCPGSRGVPAYLAFFFQSSNTETPVGLGAFVDNLVISGSPWYKNYLPSLRKDPTPTPTATPTSLPQTLVKMWDFEPGSASTSEWCQLDQSTPEWNARTTLMGGSEAYFLRVKVSDYLVMQSPRFDPPQNYRITSQFNLLRLDSGRSLAGYIGSQFGLIFGVDGQPFSPDDKCVWAQGAGGYYKYVIRVNSSGTGFTNGLERWTDGYFTIIRDFQNLPTTISRGSWNTIQLDRNGYGIQIYINGVKTLDMADGTYPGTRWFGIFTEALGNNQDGVFEGDWDNMKVYNLTP